MARPRHPQTDADVDDLYGTPEGLHRLLTSPAPCRGVWSTRTGRVCVWRTGERGNEFRVRVEGNQPPVLTTRDPAEVRRLLAAAGLAHVLAASSSPKPVAK